MQSANDKTTGGRINPDMCAHCNVECTTEGYDACIGELPYPVMNACCGHGDYKRAYVQLDHNKYKEDPNFALIIGADAVNYMAQVKLKVER